MKPAWAVASAVLAVTAIALAWPVYIGLAVSPYSGQPYSQNPATGQVARQRGYVQAYQRIEDGKNAPWIQAGQYIRQNSRPEDPVYVWGWYPGIYVEARRTAPIPRAFESEMHVVPPDYLTLLISDMVKRFQQNPPKFIVDSQKSHFPNDRPPLDLWPRVRPPSEFLPNQPPIVAQYEQQYAQLLTERINPLEAQRFEAMKPLRDFVMNHYRVVRMFGPHILFEYKGDLAAESPAPQTREDAQPQ